MVSLEKLAAIGKKGEAKISGRKNKTIVYTYIYKFQIGGVVDDDEVNAPLTFIAQLTWSHNSGQCQTL